jgi:hypothetical protein
MALSQNFYAMTIFEDFDHLRMSSLKSLQKDKFLGFSALMTYLGYY